MIRKNAVPHDLDEVLVTFEEGGRLRNHLLRGAGDLFEKISAHDANALQRRRVLEVAMKKEREDFDARTSTERAEFESRISREKTELEASAREKYSELEHELAKKREDVTKNAFIRAEQEIAAAERAAAPAEMSE